MDSINNLLVKIRDFGYTWSIKQYDEKHAFKEYKFKFFVFTSSYTLTLLLIIYQIIFYLFDVKNLPVKKYSPFFPKVLFGLIVGILPIWLAGRFLLKKIEHIQLKRLPLNKFYRDVFTYMGGAFFWWVLVGVIGMGLTTYLRDGRIAFGSLVINEGGELRSLHKDLEKWKEKKENREGKNPQ